MKRKLRILSILTVVTLLFSSVSVYAAAPQSIDAFLLDAGFSQAVIDEMSTTQKELIYEQSAGLNVEFCGYEKKEFTLDDNGQLQEASNGARSGVIPSSDMTLAVYGMRVYETGGNIFYMIYPSFKWHTHKKVANDAFSMSMYSGWSAIPGEQNFRLHLLNNQGQQTHYVDIPYYDAYESGYVYKIPRNIGFMQALYEGYAYFHVNKTSDSAYPAIRLHYAHDTSSSYNLSFSINIYFASISISGNTEDIDIMTGLFDLPALAE